MQYCPMCYKLFYFSIPVGERVICKECSKKLDDVLDKMFESFKLNTDQN